MSAATIIQRAQVAVSADTSQFDTAMGLLPGRARKTIQQAVDAINNSVKQINGQIPISVAKGDMAAVTAMIQRLAQLGDQMEQVRAAAVRQAAAQDKVSAAVAKAGNAARRGQGGFNNLGYGVLMVSQAVEDLQYGFSAIVNNIPMIAMSLGAGPGVAGAASFASVALNVLINHWDKLSSLLGQSKVKTAAEEMEELRKKTSLTADEAERLRRAEALPTKVKELRGAQTEEQKKTEEAVSHAIKEAGTGDVARGVLRSAPELIDKHGEAAVAAEDVRKAEKNLQFAKDDPGNSEAGPDPMAIRRAQQALDDAKVQQHQARKATAEQLAATGALPSLFPGGLDQLKALVDKNPDHFGAKSTQLRADLDAASPESRRREREDERREQGRKDIAGGLLQSDKDASGAADLEASDAQQRLDEARRTLARAMEEDPYATGKISAAEEAYRKAVEAHRAKREEAMAGKEERTRGMVGWVPGEEIDERQRGEQARRQEADAQDQRSREEAHDIRRKRAGVAGRGMEDRYDNEILAAHAMGQQVDRNKLQGRVESNLKLQGHDANSARELAPEIVADLLKGVEGRVKQRSAEEGISGKEAAYQELAKETTEDQKRGQGGFGDSVSFYQKLQQSQDQKDPYQAVIADQTRRGAEASTKLYEFVKGQRKGEGGGLQGPP